MTDSTVAGAETLLELVSVRSNERPTNARSYFPALSADGQIVAFDSEASNLVPGPQGGIRNIFVRNRRTGRTVTVSVGLNGQPANDDSVGVGLSRGGRYVVFYSDASNLVPGDSNGTGDIFVHDRASGTVSLVSVGRNGQPANGVSYQFSMSANGRFVAFASAASNLVAGDTNDAEDVFVRDRDSGITRRVSVKPDGRQIAEGGGEPVISAGGRYLLFESSAPDLVPNDTNDWPDIFRLDRQTGAIARVSIGTGGVQVDDFAQPLAISENGRLALFESRAANLVANDTNGEYDLFVRDTVTATTTRVNVGARGQQANSNTFEGRLSPDGRYVVFGSNASNLVPGDTNNTSDVFLRDRRTGTTRRIALTKDGGEIAAGAGEPAITPDASLVAFASDAPNLVPNDPNDRRDIFIRSVPPE